ncbi:elongation factor 4 [Egicoccus halophilus]|uniref:Elongation factor 4 n=1 Tax=Egicoccus halophilus TaxID=1670830 RepID=A0A8J3ACB6_9ACTN|nr:translation elongation factor 4 [Egicoccus halophilus]GGI08452.1 elongation factor 4 [Egicoccus halophilus]
MTYPIDRIRNFCIVAHVDHGKSTLADRMLQLTELVDPRKMRAQYLDKMDIERERGITIKAQAARLPYKPLGDVGDEYLLNLIDTPGHVDFSYEVSRALNACEGAVLLVDAAQGMEAQTIANLYLALEADLEIIPVMNKIDLPAARPEEIAREIAAIIGGEPEDVLRISAKTGEGVREVMDAIVDRVPAPTGDPEAPTRALIFDSFYDAYRGTLVYFRVVDGRLEPGHKIRLLATNFEGEIDDLAVNSPEETPIDALGVGEVGVLSAAIKNVAEAKVGDTITLAGKKCRDVAPLPGYREPLPMVFSGLYPIDSDDFPLLRDALDKLRLNDASFSYEPETSAALGFGFRCGFLGLLHLEIVIERIDREFDIPLVTTAPSVRYRVTLERLDPETGEPIVLEVSNPQDLPEPNQIAAIAEPTVRVMILTPSSYVGPVMQLCEGRRGNMEAMDYLTEERVELRYQLPLASIITDFFDQLKSITRGYASLDYEPSGYQESNLVRVDVLLNAEPVDAFSSIVHRDEAYPFGKAMVEKLKELIPRQMFDVPVQAAIGSKVIARETIKARRKDVLAKCYGGDVSRKRKLLEKQKEGKKKMKNVGSVEIPQEAFVSALRTGGGGTRND